MDALVAQGLGRYDARHSGIGREEGAEVVASTF